MVPSARRVLQRELGFYCLACVVPGRQWRVLFVTRFRCDSMQIVFVLSSCSFS